MIDEFSDCAATTLVNGDEQSNRPCCRVGIGGGRGKTTEFHGRDVVHVIAHECDLIQGETARTSEITQCNCLVFATSVDVFEVEFTRKMIRLRGRFP